MLSVKLNVQPIDGEFFLSNGSYLIGKSRIYFLNYKNNILFLPVVGG